MCKNSTTRFIYNMIHTICKTEGPEKVAALWHRTPYTNFTLVPNFQGHGSSSSEKQSKLDVQYLRNEPWKLCLIP